MGDAGHDDAHLTGLGPAAHRVDHRADPADQRLTLHLRSARTSPGTSPAIVLLRGNKSTGVTDNAHVTRTIVLYGDPVLHSPCAPVEEFGDDLGQLVDDLFASMYAADGVGLAANQIGVGLRVFVYDCPGPGGGRRAGHVVNPVRISRSPVTRLLTDEEGCLSIPGQHADVARAATTTVV